MTAMTSQKKRRDCVNQSKLKSSSGVSIPLRMSSCSFKRPVTRITSHPDNEVRRHQWEANLAKPHQVSLHKRLQGLRAAGTIGELFRTLDLAKTLPPLAPSCTGASRSEALAAAVGSGSPAVLGLSSRGGDTTPGLGLGVPQPLWKQVLVTEEDIEKQERKVETARERLAIALTAD